MVSEKSPSSDGQQDAINLSTRYIHLAKARTAIDAFSGGQAVGLESIETTCLIACAFFFCGKSWFAVLCIDLSCLLLFIGNESLLEDNESAWIWCSLSLRLAESVGVYSKVCLVSIFTRLQLGH